MASKSKRLLAKYRSKRDFKKTAEPTGAQKIKPGSNSYLIQKHDARRLHYDFRLEMDGVLKSWAVTRGPSLNPEDKRLAVHVEDHPLDYGTFEGTIPHGEYGGGTVMLWDQGSWSPIGDAQRSYKKGNLTFELHGKRLKGRWHLVRMRGKRGGDEKRENWLLIKGNDQYANADFGDAALEKFQKSVVSKRSMQSIAIGKGKVWKSNKAMNKPAEKPVKKPAAKQKPARKPKKTRLLAPPDFIPPQLATLVSSPPSGDAWVHEIKFDGYRLLARIEDGDVTLTTRANNDWTAKFKELAALLAKLGVHNALIDGEVVHSSGTGAMSFHALQNALSTGKKNDLHYYAFDLLFLNGEDMRSRPLLERKAALKRILSKAPKHIHYSDHFAEPGAKVLNHACHIALEGIVSKRADAAYHSGRDELWLKSKCIKEQEVVIGGFTMQPKHPNFLGALLMGYYEKGDFIFAGKVGTGFTNQEGRDLLKKLKKIEQKQSPFKTVPSASRRGALFVKPQLVAHVNFSEWTPDGHMRHPSFQGQREDKPAREVVREKPKAPPLVKGSSMKKSANKSAPVKIAKSKNEKIDIAGITISHPNKVLYPDSKITKLDVAQYYEKIAPLMLRHIEGRPISLMRCPSGASKACFFQRHGGDGTSPYIKEINVKGHGADRSGKEQPFLMIDDIKGLIALVQMGSLEIHVWGAAKNQPKQPNRLVFDLDPAPGVSWTEVKKAALLVRDNLKKAKLASFLKTTGGKGLHIVVPFNAGPSWDEAKEFARAFSDAMAQQDPSRFTINSRKAARTGKIFIDYLRNGETASAIAPYSIRARDGAPVALPIDWKELSSLKAGNTFNMQAALKRLKKDPWKSLEKTKQKLPL
jgi:bifunctional non-homologous end joining protein LigD